MLHIMLEYILHKHMMLVTISQIIWADDITVNKCLHFITLQWQHLPKSAGGNWAQQIAQYVRSGTTFLPAF